MARKIVCGDGGSMTVSSKQWGEPLDVVGIGIGVRLSKANIPTFPNAVVP